MNVSEIKGNHSRNISNKFINKLFVIDSNCADLKPKKIE